MENYRVPLLLRSWQVARYQPEPATHSVLAASQSELHSALLLLVCVCVPLQTRLMASMLRFNGRVVLVTGAGGGEYVKAGGRVSSSLSCWETPGPDFFFFFFFFTRFGRGYTHSCSCGPSIWVAGRGD